MGVQGSHSLLWNVKSLTLTHFTTLLRAKFPNEKIRIDVDCSWVAIFLGRGKRAKEVISVTANFLVTLAQAGGFVVTPVLDGDCRHHSKRATTKRRASREISRIDAVQT